MSPEIDNITDKQLIWTDEFLDKMRHAGDPVPDQVVATLDADKMVYPVFKNLVSKVRVDLPSLPPVVQAYFADHAALAPWADWDKIRLGQYVYSQHSREVAILLYFRAMPISYACWRIAEVLYISYQHNHTMEGYSTNLMAQASYFLSTLRPGGLDPGSSGVEHNLKTRLMHSMARYLCEKGDWDYERLGLPVNQEDIAIAIQTASTLILEGMEKMGIQLSIDERIAFFHLWRVAATLVGVHPLLIPDTYEQGLVLSKKMLDRSLGYSEPGKKLTGALIQMTNSLGPQRMIGLGPEALIRHYAGDRVAACLGIDTRSAQSTGLMPRMFDTVIVNFTRLQRMNPFFTNIAEKVNPLFIDSYIDFVRKRFKDL